MLKKLAIGTFKVFCIFFVLVIVAFDWYELPIGDGALRKIGALLDPDAYSKDLPSRVGITIDGVTATFYKGTPTYNQFITLLRRVRADQLPSEEFNVFPDTCGEMVVHSFGIPFHFRLYRSTTKHNYYWLEVPNSTGMEPLEIADDGKLLTLIHNPSHALDRTTGIQSTLPFHAQPPMRPPLHRSLFYGK